MASKIMLHITKTAGGTLKTSLMNTEDLNVEFLYGPADLEKLQTRELDSVELIYGHTMMGVGDQLGLPDARYMCFMRHPVARTISHYYHLRNVEKGPVGEKIRQSEDINDFFENFQHWEFSNFMAKVISGVGPGVDENRSLVQTAMTNINDRFDFVGFQEYFPLSLRKLSKTLGKQIKVEKDINIGRYTLGSVSEATITKIEDINKADIELYKFSLNKFL